MADTNPESPKRLRHVPHKGPGSAPAQLLTSAFSSGRLCPHAPGILLNPKAWVTPQARTQSPPPKQPWQCVIGHLALCNFSPASPAAGRMGWGPGMSAEGAGGEPGNLHEYTHSAEYSDQSLPVIPAFPRGCVSVCERGGICIRACVV